MLASEKTAQQTTLAAIRASFNKDIAGPVNLAGQQLQANNTAKSSPELTSVIAAFNATVRALNASGQTLLKAIADTEALIPTDPVSIPPVGLGASNQRTGIVYPGAGGPSSAFAAAAEGDTILVNPGVYKPFAINLTKTLTVKSAVAGKRYVFDAGGAQNRLIELGIGVGLTLEDAELCNNKAEWANAGGIWPTGGAYALVVRRCVFHDLNNGIIIGQHPDATVLIEDSEAYDNGDYDGLSHNFYVGTVGLLTFRRNLVHAVKKRGDPGVANSDISWGHLLKSRARVSIIEDNRFLMGSGEANRCIDLPNGGDVAIRRNLLEYRTPQNSGNGQFISFGVEEGENFAAHHPVHSLIIEDNTAVNRAGPLANFLWINYTPPTTYIVRNNIFSGANQPSIKGDPRWAIDVTSNRAVPLTAFVNLDGYDWRLLPEPWRPVVLPPIGFLDGVTTGGLAVGWVLDHDDTAADSIVRVFIDGPAGIGTLLSGPAVAVIRPDVNTAYRVAGNHGFNVAIPDKYLDGKLHSVFIYGVAANDPTVTVLLSQCPGSFTLGGAPILPLAGMDQWSPTKDADGNVTQAEWDSLPLNRWVEWMGTSLESQLSPPYGAAAGYIDPGVERIAAHYGNFTGAGFDEANGRFYHFGGGHAGSANNMLSRFDAAKGVHSVVIQPTHQSMFPAGYATSGSFSVVNYPSGNAYSHFPSAETPAGDDKPCASHEYSGIVFVSGINEVLLPRFGWFHAQIDSKTWRVGPQTTEANRQGFKNRGGIGFQAHYLASTGLVYLTSEGGQISENAGYFNIVKYDPVKRAEVGVIGWDAGGYQGTSCVVGGVMYYWQPYGVVSVVDLANSVSIKGRTPCIGRIPEFGDCDCPAQYIAPLDKILMWATGGRAPPGELLEFDRSNLEFRLFPIAGTPPPVPALMANKMRYWPEKKVLMFNTETRNNVRVIKLA